ncbi:MAG: hypothetical protein CFE29_03645 [Bradyrhizobiaceae bacterium PARB1]|jgi:DNA-binding Lrp family transcriptional regulator|nr:MAG: hypothetical protein CFE29_03645 [Bradyrhizobiaceae bacterium PARB1]
MIVTDRDLRLLLWLNGWGWATLEQIATWLGIDFSTAARRVRKLIEAGLIKRIKIDGLTLNPIAVTRAGCQLVGDDLPPLSGVRVGALHHDAMMVDLEQVILRQRPTGLIRPERRIRSLRGNIGEVGRHTPDAELHEPGRLPIAFELELSRKTPKRIQGIIDQYATSQEYSAVFYVVTSESMSDYVLRFTEGMSDLIKVRMYRG